MQRIEVDDLAGGLCLALLVITALVVFAAPLAPDIPACSASALPKQPLRLLKPRHGEPPLSGSGSCRFAIAASRRSCVRACVRAVLSLMPRIIPWFIRILQSRRQRLEGQEAMIVQLRRALKQ